MFIRAHYPPKNSFKFLRIREEGCLWITEYVITYDGYPVNTVIIMEFRDGKVSHETHYFADPFEHRFGDLSGSSDLNCKWEYKRNGHCRQNNCLNGMKEDKMISICRKLLTEFFY
jgi:hypothetical protein